MWYPNRAQWRVIWLMATAFSLLALFIGSHNQNAAPVLVAVLIDGILYIWNLQKGGDSH
jgi:hypothetical protein